MDEGVLLLVIGGVAVVQSKGDLLEPLEDQGVLQGLFGDLGLFDELAEISIRAVLKEDVEGVPVIPWLEIVDDLDDVLILDLLQFQCLGYEITLELQTEVTQVTDFEHD